MKHIGFWVNVIQRAGDKWRNAMSKLNISFASLSIVIVFIFICTFLYLNQKVNIYVAAYQLNDNYNNYEELSSKRDYLMYSYNKHVSVPMVNQWASRNNFSFGSNGKMIALNLRAKGNKQAQESKLASVFNRVVAIPAGVSTALAHNAD